MYLLSRNLLEKESGVHTYKMYNTFLVFFIFTHVSEIIISGVVLPGCLVLNLNGDLDRLVCVCMFTVPLNTALFVLGPLTVISGVNFLREF